MARTTVRSLAELDRYVATLATTLRGGDTVGLIGPLGAGKTTLVQALARHLGVAQRPRSPSYTLLQPYPLPAPINGIATLVHVDAYRIAGSDLLEAGLADYLHDPTALTVVEWADRLPAGTRLTYTITIHPGRTPNSRTLETVRRR